MQLIGDLHTHTLASDHAYSTLLENIHYAAKHGMKVIAITNHAPALYDAPCLMHFSNLKVVPEVVEGIRVLKGAEANIVDYKGGLDIPQKILMNLDWVVASFHSVCCNPGNVEQNTDAYIGAVKNPYVDLIGHSGQIEYLYDFEKLIKIAKEYDKVIEINEGSYESRKGSEKNCAEIAKLCKKYKVKVSVDSDAHFATSVGVTTKSIKMLKEIDFPERLVLNSDYDRLMEYINNRKNRIK